MDTRAKRNIRTVCGFLEGLVYWFGLLGLLMVALVVRYWIELLMSH